MKLTNADLVYQLLEGISAPEIAKVYKLTKAVVYSRIAYLRKKGVKIPTDREPIDVKALNKLIDEHVPLAVLHRAKRGIK